jgi:menaquinol-cytochrome c reductase iron-sulfur subunit
MPENERDSEARRGFLRGIVGMLGGLMGALAVVPGLAFLADPLRRPTVTGGGVPLRVASRRAVKPGKPLRVNVVGQQHDAWLRLDRVKLGSCWLVSAVEGAPVRAFSTVCPHLGCGIDWNDKTGRFDCPCHASSFDTEGRCLGGPSPRGLDELAVTTDGDDVKVRYRRFQVGTPDKEPIG